jgi:GH15 family glucan-1,4-alpha-glucosidase
MKKSNIKQLIQVSKNVIQDSALENGAIVAANSDKSIYPAVVQDYRYVWVRDAAYTCIAADLLGLKHIPERFFDWCLNRPEGFRESGLFLNAYHVNGTVAGTLISPADARVLPKPGARYIHTIHHGTQFQPDQNGSLILAIDNHIAHFHIRNISRFQKLISTAASGIAASWKNGRFILPCFDLWEERCILPGQARYHTYSLAICMAGLRAAIKLLAKKKDWLQTENQMTRVFEDMYASAEDSIPRTYTTGKLANRPEIKRDDYWPDASLLGLVYPARILDPLDKKMKKTVDRIIKRNTIDNGGLLRYPGDVYCGGVRDGWVTHTGAGAWPILSFWMAVYFSLSSDTQAAEKHFTWPLNRIRQYLPEQIFKDKARPSIRPLTWSHAMFIITADLYLPAVRFRT